ncbi:hypothetical protein CY34DRAFT_486048 [Suillus luteus UH-Slu-Lm8-n1]|uniref:Uncharacterized protein n=1 Tax=Suillus luteus UH-Slu-Lm8-n1 TaxID=930992 RepID=A0A0D0ARN0_9AGAM|nr:hypothetical protein CY34DRAFT_486048 [Suillus luteus UH-Slu-Lm8-n1]
MQPSSLDTAVGKEPALLPTSTSDFYTRVVLMQCSTFLLRFFNLESAAFHAQALR